VEAGTAATGPVLAAQVWERYAVPARWPEWAPQIIRVEASGPRIAAGVAGRVRGPLGVRVRFTITEVDEVRRTWAWRVWVGPLVLRLRHGVQPHPAGSASWLPVRGRHRWSPRTCRPPGSPAPPGARGGLTSRAGASGVEDQPARPGR
jgi:hypothetical protein